MDLPKLSKIGEGPYQPVKFQSYASIAKGLPKPALQLAKPGQGPYQSRNLPLRNNNTESVYELNLNQLVRNTVTEIDQQVKETKTLENVNLPLLKQRNVTWVNKYKRKKVSSGTNKRRSTRKQRKNKMIGTR